MNKNSIAPSIQLQSLGGFLTVIAYRRWDFRTPEASNVARKQEKKGSATYIQFPKEIDNGNGAWKSFGSISNLEERVCEKGEIVRNFLIENVEVNTHHLANQFCFGHK